MTQTCSIPRGRKISYCVMAMIPLIISIYLFHSLYLAIHVSVSLLVTALILLAVPVLVVINVVRKKVIVEEDRITYIGLFSQNKLLFSSIKEYRIGYKNIYLEPLLRGDPTIVIGHYRDLENGLELMQWIKEAFPDLNTMDLVSQRAMVLTNALWGATEEARKKTLSKAHTLTLIYNIASFPLVLTLVLGGNKTSLVLLLVYPFVGILLIMSGRGLIKFQSDKQRSICAFVVLGILAPGLALLLRSLADNDVLDTAHLWAPALSISFLLFILIYVKGINRSMGMLRPQVIAMILTALSYGFGITLQVNRIFDPLRPKVYNVAILDSHEDINDGKTGTFKSYSLIISPWGPRHEAESVNVPGSLYRRTQKGDTVQVNLGEGLLHIPWFVVTIDGEKKE